MDPFTQNMLDRARQRREVLAKKMAETTGTPQRKRGPPLGESQEHNIQTQPSSMDQGDKKLLNDDSPNKRQCTREEEMTIKADTPAIPGVRSRLNQLSRQRENWDNDNTEMETQMPSPRKAPEPFSLEPAEASAPSLADTKSPKPTARRNRLAALAQNINSWEDDLSRPSPKNEEKPKKVWQPPKPLEVEADAPSKPPRTFEHTSPKRSPVKPVRQASPVKTGPSPAKRFSPEKKASDHNVVSTLTVKLGSTESKASMETMSVAPGKSQPVAKSASPVKQTANAEVKRSLTKVTVKPSSPVKSSPVRKSDENEPTRSSVSARLAAWQHKVEKVENKGESALPTALAKIAAEKNGPTKNNAEPNLARNQAPRAGHVASAVKHQSPQKLSPQKSPQKTSTAVSPQKLGPGTKSLQDRLNQMQKTAWQGNDIAEKMKTERKAELEALNNRWKSNGLPAEDNNQTLPGGSQSPSTPVPPPPPPLTSTPVSTPGAPTTSPAKTKPASPKQASTAHGSSPAKTLREKKREECRDKLRNETEENGGGNLQTTESSPNFENKLKAMGFEMNSVADLGHVATLDLTPQRQRDQAAKAAASDSVTLPPRTTAKLVETKVTTTTFSDKNKVSVTEKVKPSQTAPPPQPPAAAAPAPSGGRSLYSLIKKQAAGSTSPFASPAKSRIKSTASSQGVSSRARPAPVNDSFEDTEDSFETDMPPSTSSTEGASDKRTSQSSLQSESSQYSETGTENTEDDYSDTEADNYTEDYTETEEATTQDESEYSESESDGEIDDLLDEGLDDTALTTESEYEASKVPVPMPRAQKAKTTVQEDYPVVMRQKQTPTRAQRPKSQPEYASTGPRQVRWASGTLGGSSEASSTESEMEERPVAYTINQYRSENAEKRKSDSATPKMIVVRHSMGHIPRPHQEEEPLPYIPEVHVKEKIKELQELVNQEQSVIMQTSNALNQCCGASSSFAGSAEAVECHRLLLMACKKRETYLTEMQLMREGRSKLAQAKKGPQGSLTISDIRLPLKQDFMDRIGTPRDTTVHYFIVMLRHNGRAVFTQMVSTHGALSRASLDFPNLIQLSNITQDFRTELEVYGMNITREPTVTPKKKKGLTPKKKAKTPSKSSHLESPGGPYAVRTTNFTLLASLNLGLGAVNRTHFSLERVPYSSPLQGSIHLKMRCLMESHVEEKGFLTMFEDVSGFGAWHRRWCVLKNHFVSFWKYPDDENHKEPIGHIDLKLCITDEVGLIPRDICARPNSFELRTVRRQQRGETDTLVSKCYNTMTTTKHWLSADTKDERLMWCSKMNEALRNVRAWHQDALRPIKKTKSTNPYDSESNC